MTESDLKIETDRVRVTEWRLPPGDQTGHHKHEYDYVVVPLMGGELPIKDTEELVALGRMLHHHGTTPAFLRLLPV